MTQMMTTNDNKWMVVRPFTINMKLKEWETNSQIFNEITKPSLKYSKLDFIS